MRLAIGLSSFKVLYRELTRNVLLSVVMLYLRDSLTDFLHGRYRLQYLEYDLEVLSASEFGHGRIALLPRQAFGDESGNVETGTLSLDYL